MHAKHSAKKFSEEKRLNKIPKQGIYVTYEGRRRPPVLPKERSTERQADRDAERWREMDRDTDRDTETETQSHRKTLRGGALPGSETVSAGAHPWVQLAFKRRSRVSGLGPGSTWLFACCQLTDFGHVLLVWLKLRGQPGLSVRAALASRKDRVGRESPGGPGRWAGGRPWWRGPTEPRPGSRRSFHHVCDLSV